MKYKYLLDFISDWVREFLHGLGVANQVEPDTQTTDDGISVLNIQKIIALIEKNGGPSELDLSGQDLSHVDLGPEAVRKEMHRRGYRPGQPLPVWVSPFAARGVRGLSLKEANLQGSNLRFANLQAVDFTRANLKGADLKDTRLQHSNFFQANLHQVRLWRANLGHATFHSASLNHASFYRAEFEDTDFQEADLRQTVLNRTDLSKVIVNRNSFSERLIYETPREFFALAEWDDPEMTPFERKREVMSYLERGRDAYRGLKTSFSNNGMYRDASWAYYRERVLERKMHSPGQVMLYYGDEIRAKKWYPIRYLFLHLKHLIILLGRWLEDISCGYGEKPFRSLLLGAVVILVFVPIYQLSGGVFVSQTMLPGWLDYLIFSMSTFATVSLPRFSLATPLAEFLTSLEALLGIAILALLMFALGNRIGRS